MATSRGCDRDRTCHAAKHLIYSQASPPGESHPRPAAGISLGDGMHCRRLPAKGSPPDRSRTCNPRIRNAVLILSASRGSARVEPRTGPPWRGRDSNPQHPVCNAGALPIELQPQVPPASRLRINTGGCNALYSFASERQDSNLRYLGPKPRGLAASQLSGDAVISSGSDPPASPGSALGLVAGLEPGMVECAALLPPLLAPGTDYPACPRLISLFDCRIRTCYLRFFRPTP